MKKDIVLGVKKIRSMRQMENTLGNVLYVVGTIMIRGNERNGLL